MLRHFFAFIFLSTTACLHVRSPGRLLDEADAALGPAAKPRTLALAGFHSWLQKNQPNVAQERFAKALAQDPNEPLALYGQAVLAVRAANPQEATQWALALCERAPQHALCASGARIVFDASGLATGLDQTLVTRIPKILEKNPIPDAAALLRATLANVYLARRDTDAYQAVLAAQGVPTVTTLMGPFSAFHLLELEQPTPVEVSGEIKAVQTSTGAVLPRTMNFKDGRLTLSGEPPLGDVYVFAFDIECPADATYVIRTTTGMDHAVTLDGTSLQFRRTWEKTASTVSATAVKLTVGKHRLMIRTAKDESQGHLYVALTRLDGLPSDLKFKAASGPAPSRWKKGAVTVVDAPLGVYPSASAFAQVMEREFGEGLGRFIAATDAATRDHDGAKALVASLPQDFGGPAFGALKARLSLQDRTVPPKVAKGRATRDLEAVLEHDPQHLGATLETVQLMLEDNRALDALEHLAQARSRTQQPVPGLWMLDARAHLMLGVDAQAALSAQKAEASLSGFCDALTLQYDLAIRRDALEEQSRLLDRLKTCPNSFSKEAERAKSRGQLEEAARIYEAWLATDETFIPASTTLATLYVSMRRFDDARRVLERQSLQWPRHALTLKQLADVYEHEGRAADALRLREKSLTLDGADLATRRIVERTKTGRELLQEQAISTEEALKAYAAAPASEDAPGAYVLDAAAVQVFPDGSMVDRVHIIQKVLDQSGIQEVAEVEIPAGAYILKMRTLKADGRVLEPENIDGKDSISLPGVQVGDFIDYEYLLAHPPRGPRQPGFTAASFYFQVANQPNNWSTYTVMAPKGTGMKVDARRVEPAPIRNTDTQEIFFHEERRVPPYIPEPNGPPSGNEWLPFVTVGAGQTGNEGVVKTYADEFMDFGQITFDVRQFADEAAQGKKGREAIQKVHHAVMHKLSGGDAALQMSASASVAQSRGSRLMLEYAALKALGFQVRLAAVRTFNSDPAPYVFPAETLLPYLCLRVELSPKEYVWLDTLVPFGPFGELPESAAGREALLMPEPMRPVERTQTPKGPAKQGKHVTLNLELTADGTLKGAGSETYRGFAAAQLTEALDAVPPEQREQALQSALSRYFNGAELSKLKLDLKRELGAEVTVSYAFSAPRFARVEKDTMVFSQATFPSMLGRRYLQLGMRRTPLYLDSVEESDTTATLQLPEGFSFAGALPEVKLNCPYGSYTRHETVQKNRVVIKESFRIEMVRVPPEDYETFGRFAGEIDLVQGRELLARKTSGAAERR